MRLGFFYHNWIFFFLHIEKPDEFYNIKNCSRENFNIHSLYFCNQKKCLLKIQKDIKLIWVPLWNCSSVFVFLWHQLIKNSTDYKLNLLIRFLTSDNFILTTAKYKALESESDYLNFVCSFPYVWNQFF